MGRAAKWLKGFLGFKKEGEPSKRRWSFSKGKDRRKSQNGVVPGNEDEASRHAIAVAAATAAVAEAAVAAAHATAAVVHLTGIDRPPVYAYGTREEWAAIAIQSHFRAYLSRRALRALRGLVRLQALVRGRIQRNQNADKLRQLQAIARAQARAHSTTNHSRINHSARASPEKVDHRSRSMIFKHRNVSKSGINIRLDPEMSPLIHHWMETRRTEDDERSDKILEVDTGKPHRTPKRRNIFSSSHDQCCQSFYSAPPQTICLSPSDGDGSSFYTATNSPQYYCASSVDGSKCRRGPFTPAKSDGPRSCLSGYTDHPSYMAYTESSKAKARSVSAPRQRPQSERTSSVNKYPVTDQRCSTLQASFSLKAYPGSGRLDRLGLPVRDVAGFSGGLCHRY